MNSLGRHMFRSPKLFSSVVRFKSTELLNRSTARAVTRVRGHQFSSLFRVRFSHTMAQAQIKEVYGDIIKSAQDQRQYRGLLLENGMKVLLISDPTTDKSSAALDVNAGSMLDPTELPGLAHFCEHMLFLGTTKYPEENSYSKYLSEHGGSSNAFTSAEHTNYYFDVAPEHLEGALDRFAQFFLCPLFTISATEREVNAVNQENDKNLSSDTWRLFQLDKATCDPKHDYSKFATGNKDTLEVIPKQKGIDVRSELLNFHKKYYSSNLMALSVLGKESLDDLEKMVLSMFAGVENKNLTVPHWDEHPYGPQQLKVEIDVVPVKDIRSLNVTFPIPDLHPYYKSNPGSYLGHLIGHEGPGGLLSELKSRGWVNQLVGGQKYGARGFMFFILNVDLTEEGLEHTDDIVTLLFQYIAMLKKEGPQEWIFNECRDLTAMQFRFKDKERPSGYTCQTASLMQDYPMREALAAGYLLEKFDPDLIKMVLDKLTPENVRVAVIAQKFQGGTDKKEQYYGTDYSIKPITPETLKKWQNCGYHENLKLPKKNEFIPTDFELVPREKEITGLPSILIDTPLQRLWYKQDDAFLLPKACVSIELTSPYAYMDPLSCNLTYMFVSLFRDALNEYAYDAELAGLVYDLNNTVYGLTLSVKGYHHKQPVFLKKILDKMTSFDINPQRFNVLLENYVRSLKNFRAEQPHQHAIYYTSVLMAEQMWTKEELIGSTDDVTLERLQAFIPELLSRLYVEMLVYGNVDQERAHSLASIVQDSLVTQAKTKPLLSSQQKRYREHQLPDGCWYVYRNTNDVHRSSSLEVYYQCSTQETRNNMLLELFCQIISEPCFDILRTQEQLGYIVFSGVRRSSGVQGLRVIIQSEKSPDYVETRIESFLEKMSTLLEEMDEESFKKHVEALATKRLEKPKKLSSQHARYWSEITSQQYNFDRDNIEVAFLRTVTKEELIKFFKDLIAENAPRRHKLSVHVVSAVNGEGSQPLDESMDGVVATAKAEKIEDVSSFKRGLGMFPLPKPYINLKNAAKSKL